MDEYLKGKEIGELVAEMRNMNTMLADSIKNQNDWNIKMDTRVTFMEQWVQTTTGKIVVLTTLFGVVGSICYILINWAISHFFK